MPKTAIDPFFATNSEPISAGRRGQAAVASANDLPYVTSSLLVTASAAGTVTVLMANDLDTSPLVIPFAIGTYQISIQVRAITAIGAGITGVIAFWS